MPATIAVFLYDVNEKNSDSIATLEDYMNEMNYSYSRQFENHSSTYFIAEPIDVSDLPVQIDVGDSSETEKNTKLYQNAVYSFLSTIYKERDELRLDQTNEFNFAIYYEATPFLYQKVRNFFNELKSQQLFYHHNWLYFQFMFCKSSTDLKNKLNPYTDTAENGYESYKILLGKNPFIDNFKQLLQSSAIFMFTASNTSSGLHSLIPLDAQHNIEKYFFSMSAVQYEQLDGDKIKHDIKDIEKAKDTSNPSAMISAAVMRDFEEFYRIILEKWRFDCDYIPVPAEMTKTGAGYALCQEFSDILYTQYFSSFELFCQESIQSFISNQLSKNSSFITELNEWIKYLQNDSTPTALLQDNTALGIKTYFETEYSSPEEDTSIFSSNLIRDIKHQHQFFGSAKIFNDISTKLSNQGRGNQIINEPRVKEAVQSKFTKAYHKYIHNIIADIDLNTLNRKLAARHLTLDVNLRTYNTYPDLLAFNEKAMNDIIAFPTIPRELQHTISAFLLFVSQDIENDWDSKYSNKLSTILSSTHDRILNPLLHGIKCTLFCVDAIEKASYTSSTSSLS